MYIINICKYFINIYFYFYTLYIYYFVKNISIKKHLKYNTIYYKDKNKIHIINMLKDEKNIYKLIKKNIHNKSIMYACIIKNEIVVDITDKLNSFIHYNNNNNIYWYHFFDTLAEKDFLQLIIYKNDQHTLDDVNEIHSNINDIYYLKFKIK
jgi:hypothetical protein